MNLTDIYYELRAALAPLAVVLGLLAITLGLLYSGSVAADAGHAHGNPASGDLTGVVTRVIDGDTVVIYNAGKGRIKVRLAGIDAPEAAQPWGSRASDALSSRINGKRVKVKVIDRDRYGRAIARITQAGTNVNRWMVEQGHAWVYRKYARDPELAKAEKRARMAGRGLWSQPAADITPPWKWRSEHRQNRRSW